MKSQLFIMKEEICQLLNKYPQIPIDVKYFIIKDTLSDIQNIIDNMVEEKIPQTQEEEIKDGFPNDVSIDLKKIITEQASEEEWKEAKEKIDNEYKKKNKKE